MKKLTNQFANRVTTFGAALALAVGVLACSARDKDTSRPLTKVRVSFQPHLSFAPLMIAQDEGFFREEGLDVEFVNALSHEETLVALVSGDLDVRPGPMSSGFLSAVAQGAKIRVVADMGYLRHDGCTYFGVVLRKGLDTANTKAVKRIRASLDGTTRYIVHRMLEQHHIDLKSLETVRLQDAVVGNSLANGAIDAAAVSEPSLTRTAALGTRWLSGQLAAPDFQWGVLAFSDRLLTRDHDAGVRFLRAFRRGIVQYDQGKTPRNLAIITKHTEESPDIISNSCWPSYRESARINWASIDDFQAWARTQGLMERTVTQAQAWDSSFVVASDSTHSK